MEIKPTSLRLASKMSHRALFPTSTFTILGHQSSSIDKLYAVRNIRATVIVALKLWIGRPGYDKNSNWVSATRSLKWPPKPTNNLIDQLRIRWSRTRFFLKKNNVGRDVFRPDRTFHKFLSLKISRFANLVKSRRLMGSKAQKLGNVRSGVNVAVVIFWYLFPSLTILLWDTHGNPK